MNKNKYILGQAMTEYTFSLIIFFFFVIGVIQLIFLVRNYLILGNTVQESARAASLGIKGEVVKLLIEENIKKLLHTPFLRGKVEYKINSNPCENEGLLRKETEVEIYYKVGIKLGSKLTLPIWETHFYSNSKLGKEKSNEEL